MSFEDIWFMVPMSHEGNAAPVSVENIGWGSIWKGQTWRHRHKSHQTTSILQSRWDCPREKYKVRSAKSYGQGSEAQQQLGGDQRKKVQQGRLRTGHREK